MSEWEDEELFENKLEEQWFNVSWLSTLPIKSKLRSKKFRTKYNISEDFISKYKIYKLLSFIVFVILTLLVSKILNIDLLPFSFEFTDHSASESINVVMLIWLAMYYELHIHVQKFWLKKQLLTNK